MADLTHGMRLLHLVRVLLSVSSVASGMMAVGNHSLQFIAMMARLGWSDLEVRKMYNHALKNNLLKSNSRNVWLLAAKWMREEKLGNQPR